MSLQFAIFVIATLFATGFVFGVVFGDDAIAWVRARRWRPHLCAALVMLALAALWLTGCAVVAALPPTPEAR